ncbi:MAG: hypothetical protein HYR56_18595 [Acidobacteria bacterium]|nr:hypothetical protein [Acidobacteriota bacterium]MBI3424750.1 hypothetical protein [Acidobacteriota bacterium]
MKPKLMKPTYWLAAVCTLLLAGQARLPMPTAHAQFGPQRGNSSFDQVSARGQGIATAADTFSVDAEFTFSGGRYGGVFGSLMLPVKSTARLLAQNPPAADGTINAITSHVIEIKGQSNENGQCEPGEDCLLTLDRAALIPTATPGLMKLRSVLAVSDGHGRFEKACGKIDATDGDGEINFAATPPTVHWSFSGGHIGECR